MASPPDRSATAPAPSKARVRVRTILNGSFKYKEGRTSTVICSVCEKEFSYHHSTSSLKYHLRTQHPTASQSSPEEKLVKKPVQQQLSAFITRKVNKDKKEGLTTAIAEWIATSGRPLSMCEDTGFQTVLRLALDNAEFETPSRQTIQRRVNALFETGRAHVCQLLENVSSVSITVDYWTSMANESYLGVTSHFINDRWDLIEKALGVTYSTERHTAANVAEDINSVFSEWGLEGKVLSIGSDNARNMINAVKHIGSVIALPCAAHSLQLAVNRGLKEANLDVPLAKARKIVGHIKHSAANFRELKQLQKELGESEHSLVQDCPTRWNSTHDMVSRLLQHQASVKALLEGRKLVTLSDGEWEKLRLLKTLLQPCKQATVDLGGEKYVSCSIIIPLTCHMQHTFKESDDDPAFVARFKNVFVNTLALAKDTTVDFLKVATALDPRFKSLKCLPQCERSSVCERVAELIVQLEENKTVELPQAQEPPLKKTRFTFDRSSGSSSDEQPEMEADRNDYINNMITLYKSQSEIDDASCPLLWWKQHEQAFAPIAALAKKYLAAPATSVPCERLFSVAGNIVSEKRTSLLPCNVNMLLCLNNWKA